MDPAHCTSGAIYCSEISSTLAWGRNVPSVRGVPREGSTRVLPVERLCTSREDLRALLPFRPRAIWRLLLKARARSRSYTLHYSTCCTRRITQACVFTPHHSFNCRCFADISAISEQCGVFRLVVATVLPMVDSAADFITCANDVHLSLAVVFVFTSEMESDTAARNIARCGSFTSK